MRLGPRTGYVFRGLVASGSTLVLFLLLVFFSTQKTHVKSKNPCTLAQSDLSLDPPVVRTISFVTRRWTAILSLPGALRARQERAQEMHSHLRGALPRVLPTFVEHFLPLRMPPDDPRRKLNQNRLEQPRPP